MNLSKTNTQMLLRLLDDSSKIIRLYATSTREANVARKCLVLRKKLIKSCTTKSNLK